MISLLGVDDDPPVCLNVIYIHGYSLSHSEDAEFLTRHNALPASRIRAIETGGCPHAAVREDISANLGALEELHREFATEILLIESGGDNLAANYSRELADYIIYVVRLPVRLVCLCLCFLSNNTILLSRMSFFLDVMNC